MFRIHIMLCVQQNLMAMEYYGIFIDRKSSNFCIIKIELGNEISLKNINLQNLDSDLQPIEILQ